MSVDEALKYIISMGVVAPKRRHAAEPAPATAPGHDSAAGDRRREIDGAGDARLPARGPAPAPTCRARPDIPHLRDAP